MIREGGDCHVLPHNTNYVSMKHGVTLNYSSHAKQFLFCLSSCQLHTLENIGLDPKFVETVPANICVTL